MSAAKMSKKRGLSLEDKRQRMLSIFYDTQDFFLLKELEKKGASKGVILQAVKDVVQSLVDDDLVFRDKIGTSVYFWSFPSRAGNQLRQMQAKLESELEATKKRRLIAEKKINDSKVGREQSNDRDAAIAQLSVLGKKNKELKNELNQYAENDPEVLEHIRNVSLWAQDATIRWTDNIFALQQWCSNNFPEASGDLQAVYKEVGIEEDFDYVE